MNKVYKGEEARKIILEGAKELYDAVKETYGPTSGNVGILRNLQGLDITHDGVTVAKSIELKGPKQAGAEIIKNTAVKMDKDVGDGTSTVVILAYSILEAVQDALMLGESPIKIRDKLQEEAKKLLDAFRPNTDINLEVLKQVATISAGDKVLGERVAEIVFEVGENGSVTVEEGTKSEDNGEVTKGYTIDSGLVSNYMVRDPSTMSTTLINPNVLVVNKKLEVAEDLMPIVKSKVEGPILVVANDFSESIIATIIGTNAKDMTNIVFVKSPRFGAKRLEYLKDIAAVCGTKVVDEETGFDTPLGQARQITVSQDKTVVIGGSNVQERRSILEKQLKSQTDEFELAELKQRIASLNGKAAIITVGGYSSDEVSEKRYRVDDAVFACQAALRGGVVAGGGITLLDLAGILEEASILKKVLYKPFEVLLENVGLKASDYEVGNGIGVNVRTGEAVDLFKEGIIEPAETARKAVEGAVSIAGNAITMKVLVVEEEENDE